MTASELAFLSFGLVLGMAGGAGLIEVRRPRRPGPREIRVTVAPNSLPARRSVTLSEDAFVQSGPSPAHGGPADRRHVDRDPVETPVDRTAVRSPLPPAGAGDPASGLPLSRIVATRPALGFVDRGATAPDARGEAPKAAAEPVAIPIHLEPDPQLEALRGLAAGAADEAPAERRVSAVADPSAIRHAVPTLTAVADPPPGLLEPRTDRPVTAFEPVRANEWSTHARDAAPRASGAASDADRPRSEAGGAAGAPGRSDASGGIETVGCADARRVADERCAVAALAREQAEAAHEAVRTAQRAYDEHMTRAEAAAVAAEPGGIRAAKERAQHGFRDARAAADTPEILEAAARAWLDEVNRINREARDAANALIQEREAAHGLVTTIEHLTVEADAARVAAESAEAACVAARQAVADCEEAAARDSEPAAVAAAAPTPPVPVWPPAASPGFADGPGGGFEGETELGAALTATGPGEPAILRLLRGDRPTLARLVAELAGEDLVERRRWQVALAGLVDAVVARAIEAAYLQFPEDHSFWGLNSLSENRAIAAALSSLGYRFDGLGGWADDRVPSQRDLSLAVGYAGLDPMRTRRWPGEREMQELFRDVTVAADEYLASAAGEMTLGELITVLGRRADGLADLWNEWDRVRPVLLSGG